MTVEVLPVNGGEEWEVRVVGVTQRVFSRKGDAKTTAEQIAERRSMELRIRRGDGTFQTSKYTTANSWW